MKYIKIFDHFSIDENNINEIVKLLKRDCSQYVNELMKLNTNPVTSKIRKIPYSKPIILYRATHDDIINDTLIKKTVRCTRKPLDTAPHISTEFDNQFYKKFGTNVRSCGVFTTLDINMTDRYGIAYLMFPVGNYKSVYSKTVTDLYDTLDTYSYFDSDAANGYRVELAYKYGTIKYNDIDTGESLYYFIDKYKVSNRLEKEDIQDWITQLPKSLAQKWFGHDNKYDNKYDELNDNLSIFYPSESMTYDEYLKDRTIIIHEMQNEKIKEIVNTYTIDDDIIKLFNQNTNAIPSNEIAILCKEYYLVNIDANLLIKKLKET